MRYFFNHVTFHNDYVTKTYGYFFDFVLTLQRFLTNCWFVMAKDSNL